VDGPITQEALRRRLRLSKGAMSALVERMVGAGHVERRPNPEDGRSQLLRLSARSAAGREWHRGQLELRLRAAAGRYDAAQRAAILAFLADVRAAVSATTGRLRAGGPGRAG
jgi:DNA-binding MarR family transcriptional regulator